MKQMRSRFRLITLLLVCAFLLTLALCAGNTLKTVGVSFSSLSVQSIIGVTSSPDASVLPEVSPADEPNPSPSDLPEDESPLSGTDNSPVPEYNDYNVFGL